MKYVDVKPNTYINSGKEIINKDPRFKDGDNVRVSKYKNIFEKGYVPNWSKEVFVVKKVKKTVQWTFFGTFYEKNCKKQIKQNLELKK